MALPPSLMDLLFRAPRDQAPPTPTMTNLTYRVPPQGAPGPTYTHLPYRVPPPGSPGPRLDFLPYRVPPPGAPHPQAQELAGSTQTAQSLVHSIIAQMAAQRAPQPAAPRVAATGYDTTGYGTGLTPLQEAYFRIWKQRYTPDDTGRVDDLRGAYSAGVAPQAQYGTTNPGFSTYFGQPGYG